jgi:hypothetical protein
MTELTINFGPGEVRFRAETWDSMIALLSQMLDCVQPTGAVACRIEEIPDDDWMARYDYAARNPPLVEKIKEEFSNPLAEPDD